MKYSRPLVRSRVCLFSGLLALAGGMMLAGPASPDYHSTSADTANGAPMSCVNLPISGAVIQPTSCWRTTAGEVLITGTSPESGAGELLGLAASGVESSTDLPGGASRINGVSGEIACIQSGDGAESAVSLADGKLVPPGQSPCASFSPSSVETPAASQPDPQGSTMIPNVATAPSVPATSYSYYIQTNSLAACLNSSLAWNAATWACPMWQLGSDTNVPASGALVVLDFGSPCFDTSDGDWGVELFYYESTCTHDAAIVGLTNAWVSGYEHDHAAGTPTTIVADSLSNSLNGVDPGSALTTSQMSSAGTAWANDVVGAVPTASLAAPLTMWGGIDAEESGDGNWYGPTQTIAFVDAYQAALDPTDAARACTSSQPGMLADFGDAVYDNGVGGYQINPPDGWTPGDIYHVAWGSGTACALPEIYYPVMADEWQGVSDWAVQNGYQAITFPGVMSENGVDGTATSSESWSELNSVTGQSPPYVTSIAWSAQTGGTLGRYIGPDGLHWVTTGQVTDSYMGNDPGHQEGTLGTLGDNGGEGFQALYSCSIGAGHFLSLDSRCEGQQFIELDGYAATAASSLFPTQIYRCRVAWNGDHFVSTDPGCEGQVNEGSLGFVGSVLGLYRYRGPTGHLSTTGDAPSTYMMDGELGTISASEVPGSQPLYECEFGGSYFTSTSTTCEGQARMTLLGYIDSTQQTGTAPLYRCRLGAVHFDTTSSTCEGSGAILEGGLGFVGTS